MPNSTPEPFSLPVSGSGCGTAVTSLTRQFERGHNPEPEKMIPAAVLIGVHKRLRRQRSSPPRMGGSACGPR
jgi:hypothetical protein